MQKKDETYEAYLRLLKEELVPATGCTEPVAIAYAAAKVREILGTLPETSRLEVSGNIIKNAKSVIVPNTGGLKGIPTAIAAGFVAGDPDRGLEVLSRIPEEDKHKILEYRETHEIQVIPYDGELVFYISVTGYAEASSVRVVIESFHTNIVRIEKDGKVLFQATPKILDKSKPDELLMNLKEIVEFVDIVEITDIEDIIGQQIEFNTAIAQEGLRNDWGANIGKVLLKTYGNDVKNRSKAIAAVASDARMGGCDLPVVILAGSGNQSLAASLPVIEYARELHSTKETLLRAVALSDLITIHQKSSIGRLSAFCGAVSAGCSAGAGIAYLQGADYNIIAHTVVNALAIASGIVCDGAKASCAAKIATAVDAGLVGYHMYLEGEEFLGGDGIIAKGVDNTIANVGRMASKGMRETDNEIIRIMVEKK